MQTDNIITYKFILQKSDLYYLIILSTNFRPIYWYWFIYYCYWRCYDFLFRILIRVGVLFCSCQIKCIHNHFTIILFYLSIYCFLETIILFILIYHNKIIDNKLFPTPDPEYYSYQSHGNFNSKLKELSFWIDKQVL